MAAYEASVGVTNIECSLVRYDRHVVVQLEDGALHLRGDRAEAGFLEGRCLILTADHISVSMSRAMYLRQRHTALT